MSKTKYIERLEVASKQLTEQCKGLAEAAMKNGQELLLLERERDKLREAAQQALSFIDGTDLRTAPLARSTAQALREALGQEARPVPLEAYPTCALCGHIMLPSLCGSASADDNFLCHTDSHSCYYRWTVYGHRPSQEADNGLE